MSPNSNNYLNHNFLNYYNVVSNPIDNIVNNNIEVTGYYDNIITTNENDEYEDININTPSINLEGYNINSYVPGNTSDIDYVTESLEEYNQYLYHRNKNDGEWQVAKQLIQNNFNHLNNNLFIIDLLEPLLNEYLVDINKIEGLHYLDENMDYFFPRQEAQFVIENIKVNSDKIPHFRIDTMDHYYIFDSNLVLSQY